MNRFRHQHHDHERCKERRRRKKRKILVHNLDDKSLKVRKQKNTRYGLPVSQKKSSRYLSFRPRKLGNRSRWAAATCKVHHHRHCLSSADNVSAAGRNHPANGTFNRRHGWVIFHGPPTWLQFPYLHVDAVLTAVLRSEDEKMSFVSMFAPAIPLYYSWPWAVYSIFSSIRLILSYQTRRLPSPPPALVFVCSLNAVWLMEIWKKKKLLPSTSTATAMKNINHPEPMG